MYEAMCRATTRLPPDVEAALHKALAEETNPLAIKHLEISLENARLATNGCGLVCGDTGFPLFFVKAGNRTNIEGGFGRLWTRPGGYGTSDGRQSIASHNGRSAHANQSRRQRGAGNAKT